jgi:hypothetical protein
MQACRNKTSNLVLEWVVAVSRRMQGCRNRKPVLPVAVAPVAGGPLL